MVYQHVTDPPIYLKDNETLDGVHVVQWGTLIGRVLFTVRDPMVLADGHNITIKNCYFEAMHDGVCLDLRPRNH